MKFRFVTKSVLYILILMLVASSAFAVNQITFTGKNSKTGSAVTIDSIQIKNITQNKDYTLKGANTFDLDYFITSVEESANNSNNLSVSCSQSVFSGTTQFSFTLQGNDNVNVSVYSVNGEKIAGYSGSPGAGRHNLEFNSGNISSGLYIINVASSTGSQSALVTKISDGSSSSAPSVNYLFSTTVQPKAKSDKILDAGDEYYFIGFAKGFNNSALYNKTPEGGESFEFVFVPKTDPVVNSDALIPFTLFHVKDSDGTGPSAGVEVVLVFELNNNVYLYLASEGMALGYKGTYTISNSKVNIKFDYDDFKVDNSVTIDTANSEFTMPFMVFSTDAGTSKWEKRYLPFEAKVLNMFNAIASSEELTLQDAVDRVYNYAEKYETLYNMVEKKKVDENQSDEADLITIKATYSNGLMLSYSGGPDIIISFLNWINQGDRRPVIAGTLASDPRVHLNCKHPGNGISDPLHKSALFFAPYDAKVLSYWAVNSQGKLYLNEITSDRGWKDIDNIEGQMAILSSNSYSCTFLKDQDASVDNLIYELKKSPGYLYISTHGMEDGMLITGPYFSRRELVRIDMQNMNTKYPGLMTYGGGTLKNPKTMVIGCNGTGLKPTDVSYGYGITPKFWEWVVENGADFSSSLVFIGACLTDKTPDLRNAIKAKNYFAYNISVDSRLCGAISQYFAKMLTKPTFTGEEVYYNAIRVYNLQQMIYTNDTMFKGAIPVDDPPQLQTFFRGYATGGGETNLEMISNGWQLQQGIIDPGVLWWHMFTSRWGQDAAAGVQGAYNCWEEFWKDGKTGGLANPGCQNKCSGRAPTQEELAYMAWLLTADTKYMTGTIKKLARFTLYDGRN
jgi:hypothetical protein